MAMTSDGPIVAYRDRSAEEVRDIMVDPARERQVDAPRAVHDRRLARAGLPGEWPGAQRARQDVAVAWFNAKEDQPKSFGAFSSDAGRTFSAPIRLDDVASLGRVDIELLPDGSALAAYMEFAEQRAQFRVRRIRPDGSKSDPVTVSGMAGNRGSGYPRMVLSGDELVFAWTDRDTKSQVRTATAPGAEVALPVSSSPRASRSLGTGHWRRQLQLGPPQPQRVEITDTELNVIAALAQIGLISSPTTGYRIPAATGTPSAL